MLKVSGLSLTFGTVALLVVLTQIFAPPESPGPTPPAVAWNAQNAGYNARVGEFADGVLRLKLVSGIGMATLETGRIDARSYPFLHLAIADPPVNLTTSIAIQKEGKMGSPYTLEQPSPTSVWVAMNEFEDWAGTIEAIQFTFYAAGHQSLEIRDISLHPASPARQLHAIVSDLASFAPWKRAQMNTHTGVAKISSFYPVPLVVTLLLLSWLGYGLILLFSRQKRDFDWTVVALIFLFCWIALDLIWQKRLLHQVVHSYHTFAGKTTAEKLAVGPDQNLYNFLAEVKQHIEPADARVLVSSSDLYLGMRGAYYLYPFNVYWHLEGPEVPPNRYLRPGDYVVFINPTTSRFNPVSHTMLSRENKREPAELLLSRLAGKLVRLK